MESYLNSENYKIVIDQATKTLLSDGNGKKILSTRASCKKIFFLPRKLFC